VERVQVDEARPIAGGVPSSALPPPVSAPVSAPVSSSDAREIAAPVVPPSAQNPGAQNNAQSLPTYIPSAEVRAPVSTALPEVASAPVTTPIERPPQTRAATAEPEQEKTQLASLPRSNAKPRAGGKFIWPVEGKLMSEYGSKGDGLHNDGINIAAPKGAPVFAAAPGVVAYAGNEIRGFGNLLLIQHADGWMTAYAHNDKLLVRRGDRVQQGQQISAVGATGNVSSPQLHFEIRRGKRAVDPLDQLGSASARS
jgi:murein DD-endopeptidase MepM/ murein hydrolase activator NlpD